MSAGKIYNILLHRCNFTSGKICDHHYTGTAEALETFELLGWDRKNVRNEGHANPTKYREQILNPAGKRMKRKEEPRRGKEKGPFEGENYLEKKTENCLDYGSFDDTWSSYLE